mmetsp:Transcript_30876/g.118391  ORF Transcript_30876/g.118391 Transcript_30876/m.118391 type:complete len:124 (-) Transcript_30876:297-668(-)
MPAFPLLSRSLVEFWLRSLPTHCCLWMAAKPDEAILKHLGTLLDEPANVEAALEKDLIRAQIALPLRLSGFGVADRGLLTTSVNPTMTSLTERRPIRMPQSLGQTLVDPRLRAKLEGIETVIQ